MAIGGILTSGWGVGTPGQFNKILSPLLPPRPLASLRNGKGDKRSVHILRNFTRYEL